MSLRGLAILGLLLPYIVDLSLIFVFGSKIGPDCYSSSPDEWNFYGNVIVKGVLTALAASVVLPLPYVARIMWTRAKSVTGWVSRLTRCIGTALAYLTIVAVNGAMAFLLHMMAWIGVGGVI